MTMYFDNHHVGRNDHTKMTAPHPVRFAKLSIFGSVSTTVGDHVGILSVVLLVLPLLEVPTCPWIVLGPDFCSVVSGRCLFLFIPIGIC